MDLIRNNWVSRSYLEAWCEPGTNYVWVFKKDGSQGRHAAPVRALELCEFHAANVHAGNGNEGREARLLHDIENRFKLVRRKISNIEQLTLDDHHDLCAFAAVMLGKTLQTGPAVQPAFRERELESVSANHKHDLLASLRQNPIYARASQVEQDDAPEWVAGALRYGMPVLAHMRMTVLRSREDPGFITSDDPCVLTDPELDLLPAFFAEAPDLRSPIAQVTLPITPRECVLFSWRDCVLPSDKVSEVNRRTCVCSCDKVVVSRNTFRPEWLG